eukprot:6180899-Pleurochrysis_carterae.AAC.1
MGIWQQSCYDRGAVVEAMTYADMGGEKGFESNSCRRKYNCKACKGSNIHVHGRHKADCKQCGNGICEQVKHAFKECGGSDICEHGQREQTTSSAEATASASMENRNTCARTAAAVVYASTAGKNGSAKSAEAAALRSRPAKVQMQGLRSPKQA